MKNSKKHALVPNEIIEKRIFSLRGLKVILDRDIAELYQVKSVALRQQVRRNQDRFPYDFMIILSEREIEIMVSQNVIPSRSHLGGYRPYAFTEQGVAMLSSVLKSQRAVQVNIQIIRVFTKLRAMVSTHKKLRDKIETMEKKYDERFKVVFEAIKRLMKDEDKGKPTIGFYR